MIQGQTYEYHLTILNVKMKVKFPCRMKIEHQGTYLTGEQSVGQDNRYSFNQTVTLKDMVNKQCFELTVNLITDKGAKYIAGVVKLYQTQIVRSEGQRLVLSLSKCIDTEAFCEVKVDQVVSQKSNKNIPSYERKSPIHRQIHFKPKEATIYDFSPHRSVLNVRAQESKSEYQMPLHQNPRVLKHDWDTKSKSRLKPPQTVYHKSRITPRINNHNHELGPATFDGQLGLYEREKLLEAEVYKESYQKLKQKYKKQAQISKQELNKRLALQNTENNLKLEIMRMKLKSEQQQKNLSQKNNRVKEQQIQLVGLQQKEIDNNYLREQNNRKDSNIRLLEDKVRSLTRNIEQLRDYADDRSNNEGNKLKDLQIEMANMRMKFEARQKQLQKQNSARLELLHEKQLELVTKTDHLEREKKNVIDLERTIQNKQFQLQKLLQIERNSSKNKEQQQRAKVDRLERELIKSEDEKKIIFKQLQQFKNNMIKIEYDKKILHQELETLRIEFTEMKTYKEKYLEQSRQNRSIVQERSSMQRQLEKAIQNKDSSLSEINKQFQDQIEYYKRINRDQDQKLKTMANKMLEVEGQLDLSRNQQDKIRRNYQSSIKEAADAKEKQKSARKALKVKEQEMLSMETEQATLKQKLKSIDQISRLQVQKQREESDKLRIQLDNQLDRNQELQENNNQLTMELNKLKIKLQYADDKAEKDNANLKDKQSQVEALIKDYEEQISGLDQTINTLRLSEKELSTKLQKVEMELIKSEQKYERTRKDVRILEQKVNNYESNLKARTSELQIIQNDKSLLDKKQSETSAEIDELKNEHLLLTNQRNKLQKMIELLQEQVKKVKGDSTGLGTTLGQKEKQIDMLKGQLKEEKEGYVKLDLEYSNFKREIQRSKDTLFDLIQKSLFTLPLGTKEDGRKSIQLLLNKKPVENTFAQYFTMITSHTKEVKQALVKQTDSIKQLEREKQRLLEEVSSKSNKYQNTELTLKKQIEELEQQLQSIVEEKQTELHEHAQLNDEYEARIKQLQMIIEELNNQIEELNFTNNSMKMDFDVMNQQNNKKIASLKKVNTEYEQKLQYQTLVIAQLDEKCNTLETNIDNMQLTIDNEVQTQGRKDKVIDQLKEINYNNQQLLEELKKSKRELLEKVSELELYLNTEKQINEKNKQTMLEEQNKSNELKTFIANMNKQKEIAIKTSLERSETIITLESSLHQLNKDIQLLTEQNSKNQKNIESQKEVNKKLQATIKQIEAEKKEQKSRLLKVQDCLREKQKDLINKDESIKKLEQKYEKTVEKYRQELKQLQDQLDGKTNLNFEHSKESSQKIFQLESLIQRHNSTITTLEARLSEVQEELFAEKEKNFMGQETVKKSQAQIQQHKMKILELESSLAEIADEVKDKEEQLFEYSGKNFSLEQKIEAVKRESFQQLEMLNYQWTQKYESMCQQYEQRIELIQKQMSYLKNLNDEKDRQISKLHLSVRQCESSEVSTRKMFEDKLKKVEEERLAMLSGKNTESHRLAEEIKNLTENLKNKESQLRKVHNEIQVARKTITNLDLKSKDYDDKLKGVNKLFQTEMEQLKKRDLVFKNYKESMTNYMWNTERQIKKGLQNFIKTFLEVNQDRNSQRVVQLARSLEKSILDILSVKPTQK